MSASAYEKDILECVKETEREGDREKGREREIERKKEIEREMLPPKIIMYAL